MAGGTTWWHWVSGMAFVRFSQRSPRGCRTTAPAASITFSHCSKTGRKWGDRLSSCLSLFYQRKKSFLDTQQVSFYIPMSSVSHMSTISWPWRLKTKIQHLAPLVERGLCQQEDQLNKNWDQGSGVSWNTLPRTGGRTQLTRVCCDNCSSPPLVFCGPHPSTDCSWEKQALHYNCL